MRKVIRVKVNVHSHVIPRGSANSAGASGPIFTTGPNGFTLRFGPFAREGLKSVEMMRRAETVGLATAAEEWLDRFSDPRFRLEEMDEKGIDILGVTMSPIIYGYFLDPEVGRRHATTQNRCLAEYCEADPSRLFFQATLPMQDPDGAADEVDHAVGELGAKAINVAGSLLGGRELDHPDFDVVWDRVQAHNIPVFIHPSLHSSNEETEFDKWAPILGYPYQETVAFATLLLSGVLDRFPGLRFYITHGGGFVPYQFGRIERMADAYGYNASERPLRDYLSRFFFDILIHDVEARRFLVHWAGASQLVVGDNYEGVDSADGFAFLDELELPTKEKTMISGENAVALFKLNQPVGSQP